MKIRFIYIIIFATVFSCNSPTAKHPVTAMDTGRDFIRATLDGDFISAEPLLLPEPENIQLFDTYKELYSRLHPEEKAAYKNASYNINTYKDLNDSVSVINYSNSYMKKPMNIKLVKRENTWRVDFKYTSQERSPTDSTD